MIVAMDRIPVSKRNRSQLSCTHCRQSKLKCDREQPCSHCVKKGRANLCLTPSPAARKKPAANMHKRLRQLESMVKDIMTTPEGLQPTGEIRSFIATPSSDAQPNLMASPRVEEPTSCAHPSGQVFLAPNESKYIGTSSWAAILENIEEVKDYFNEIEEEAHQNQATEDLSFSALTFNAESYTTISELVSTLPAQAVVDRLISRFFNSNSPSLNIFHGPTFQKQYQQFWLDTNSIDASWLGLIFSMIALSSISFLSIGEEHPDSRRTTGEIIQLYRNCCVQSLLLSNFTKPGPHTIETLMLHTEVEFILNKANPIRFYLLVGNTVRLALRMGLHRDPLSVRSNITVFQARLVAKEMRRRVWNQLIQLELLSIFQIELPGMISTVDSDTLTPRNLYDTDFDETSIILPGSRPKTDLTPVTYAIMKGTLCKISGKISTLANKIKLPSYTDIMELDQELQHAFADIPPIFLQTGSISIIDPPEIIIKRLSLSLVFNKSRCMLHRRYLTEPKGTGEYDFSKDTAIGSSMEILRLQALVHEAFLPGRPLCQDRWFLSALSMSDFLVSGMIVYLSLIQSLNLKSSQSSSSYLSDEQQDKISMLKQSYDIWTHTDNMSAEMKRASKLIATLLHRLNLRDSDGSGFDVALSRQVSLVTERSASGLDRSESDLSSYATQPGKQMHDIDTNCSEGLESTNGSLTFGFTSSTSSATPELQGFSDNFDWQHFDNQFLPSYPMNIDWNSLSPEDLLMDPNGDEFSKTGGY